MVDRIPLRIMRHRAEFDCASRLMIGAALARLLAPSCSDHRLSTTSDAEPVTQRRNTYPISRNSAPNGRTERAAGCGS
jgi:hypothetical protein